MVVALALPLMAAPIVVTGDVTAGFITDFGTNTGYVAGMDLYFNATVDDFNTASVTIARSLQTAVGQVDFVAGTTTTGSTEDVILTAASITSKLGVFLKADPKMFAWTLTGGYTSAGDNAYVSQSAYGLEDISSAATATTWMVSTTFTFANILNLKIGLAPLTLTSSVAQDLIVGVYMAPALGTMGTLSAEVFYDANANNTGTNFAQGTVVADAKLALTPVKDLTIAVGAGLNVQLQTSDIHIGASLKGTYGTLGNLAVGFLTGTLASDSTLIGISAQVTPMPVLDILVGVKLDLTSTAPSAFHSADIAARFNIGAMDIYVGYLIGSGVNAQTVLWAPVSLTNNGGLYVKLVMSF
jgi:hypothetical protein